LGLCAPGEERIEEADKFYQLKEIMNKIYKSYYILLMGGLNARIGNHRTGKIIGTNGEPTININGKTDRLLLV
jgi:hypothetical protein